MRVASRPDLPSLRSVGSKALNGGGATAYRMLADPFDGLTSVYTRPNGQGDRKGARAVGWAEVVVDAWIREQIAASRGRAE